MISITYALKCRLLSSLIHQIFCVVFIPYSVYLHTIGMRYQHIRLAQLFDWKLFGFLTDLYILNLLVMNLATKEIVDTVLCDQNRSKNIPSTDPSNIFDDLIRSNSKSTNPVFTIFFTNICGVFFHLLMHSWEKRSHWSKLFFDR